VTVPGVGTGMYGEETLPVLACVDENVTKLAADGELGYVEGCDGGGFLYLGASEASA